MCDAATIELACLLEATAAKPGNVHPGASFGELTYADFVKSAEAAAPALATARDVGVGRSVLDAVSMTQEKVGRNTNLGIALLIAPLAAAPVGVPLRSGVRRVLDSLTVADARMVYEAVRLAAPGGLGDVTEQDVADEPTVTLLDAMRLAADRDSIASEYASGFEIVLDEAVPYLAAVRWFADNWETAVVGLHLTLMASRPDTLIFRKCGGDVAAESSELAAEVLRAGWPETETGREKLVALDRWLRADGNRRNPGTTADLVAAGLYAALREGVIGAPSKESVLRRGSD